MHLAIQRKEGKSQSSGKKLKENQQETYADKPQRNLKARRKTLPIGEET